MTEHNGHHRFKHLAGGPPLPADPRGPLVGLDGAPIMSDAARTAALERGRAQWAAQQAATMFGSLCLAVAHGNAPPSVVYQATGHGLGDGTPAEGEAALAKLREYLVLLHTKLLPGELAEVVPPDDVPPEALPPLPRLMLQWTAPPA